MVNKYYIKKSVYLHIFLCNYILPVYVIYTHCKHHVNKSHLKIIQPLYIQKTCLIISRQKLHKLIFTILDQHLYFYMYMYTLYIWWQCPSNTFTESSSSINNTLNFFFYQDFVIIKKTRTLTRALSRHSFGILTTICHYFLK